MHELSICQQMLQQVTRIAAEHGSRKVERIVVVAGPLSGVEPRLLQQAFTLARSGTISAQAELEVECGPVRVRCRLCGAASETEANRLLCRACNTWQVDVTEGDALVLRTVQLADLAEPPARVAQETNSHV